MAIIHDRLRAWQHAHNTIPEASIYRSDAEYAAACGLPTMAALCALLDRVQSARGPMTPREIESELRTVLSVAVGEGTVRLRIVLDDEAIDGVPGVPTLPAILLERLGEQRENTK